MLDIQPEFVKNSQEVAPEKPKIIPELGLGIVPVDESYKELRSFNLLSSAGITAFVNWGIRRSGLSKHEIARRMGMNPRNFYIYYKGKIGDRVSLAFIINFLRAVEGSFTIEIPVKPPRRKRYEYKKVRVNG